MSRHWQIGCWSVLFSQVVVAFSTSASAAELRTTVGDRKVVRTSAMTRTAPRAGSAIIQEDSFVEEGPIAENVLEPACGCSSGKGQGCQTCPPTNCCFQSGGSWASVDFLLGWRHGIRTPPLVTTSVQNTPQAAAGVLGPTSTTVLYPLEPIGEEARPGGRLSVGTWLDPWQCWGVEGRYFMLGEQQTEFEVTSTGDPILARPFFDVLQNAQASRLLAYPGIASPGSVTITTESEVHGGDALVRRALCKFTGGRVDLIVGYQFSRIDESLVIADSLTDVNSANLIADGTVLSITDRFATRNEFHAGSIGAAARLDRGTWGLDVLGKVGFGNMRETVTINGQTVVDVPPVGSPDNVDAFGLLAQGANLGTFSQNQFAVSPELNLKFIYHVTQCVDFTAGYTFLYWSSLAQPGRQIGADLRVPTDRYTIRESEYWVHAASVGMQVRF